MVVTQENTVAMAVYDTLTDVMLKAKPLAYGGPYSNVTLAGGFKEDFITVPILSWIMFVAYSIWVIALFILVIVRRNHQPVKARSPLLMILTLITTTFLVLSNTLRFGIGRSIFPCILYTMSFSLMQPGLFMPTVLRAWRLFFVYRVATAKEVVAAHHLKRRMSLTSESGVSDEKQSQANPETSSVHTVDVAAVEAEGKKNNNNNNNNNNVEEDVLDKAMQVEDVSDDSDAEDDAEENGKENDFDASFISVSGLNEDGKDVDLPDEKVIKRKLASRKRYKRTQLLLKSLNIWVSRPFMLGVFSLFMAFHVCVWIGSNFFNASLYFDFTQGCKLGTIQLILAVVFIGVYLVIEVIMGILLLTIKDAWFMKYEIYFNIAQWFIAVLIFLACSLISWINTVVDYYLPYGFIILLSCFIDNVVSCFIPIVASFVLQSRSASYKLKMKDTESGGNAQQNELRFLLRSRQLRRMFKQFTVQSFAPESLLCWEFIEQYKTIIGKRRRFRFARELIDKFMTPSGDFELNLPAEFTAEEYNAILASKSSNPPTTFFDLLQAHCELDLVDMFVRFKSRKDYLRVKMKEEQEIEMAKQVGFD